MLLGDVVSGMSFSRENRWVLHIGIIEWIPSWFSSGMTTREFGFLQKKLELEF